jgi:hypothetical protein
VGGDQRVGVGTPRTADSSEPRDEAFRRRFARQYAAASGSASLSGWLPRLLGFPSGAIVAFAVSPPDGTADWLLPGILVFAGTAFAIEVGTAYLVSPRVDLQCPKCHRPGPV